MIKQLLGLVLLALAVTGQAKEVSCSDMDGYFHASWTPVQLTLMADDESLFDSDTPVYGLALGFLMTAQVEMIGANVSMCAAMADRQTGVMISPLLCGCSQNYGLIASPINGCKQNYGLSVALINSCAGDVAGFVVGVWNFTQNGCGCLVGVYNDGGRGVQLGVVNVASDAWQFGLVNYNPKSILPYTILFNCPWPGGDSKPEAAAP